MARKVGLLSAVIRYCAECAYSKTAVSISPAPGFNKIPQQVHDVPAVLIDPNAAIWFWFCGKTGSILTSPGTGRNGDCPLEEIEQPDQNPDLGKPGNLAAPVG